VRHENFTKCQCVSLSWEGILGIDEISSRVYVESLSPWNKDSRVNNVSHQFPLKLLHLHNKSFMYSFIEYAVQQKFHYIYNIKLRSICYWSNDFLQYYFFLKISACKHFILKKIIFESWRWINWMCDFMIEGIRSGQCDQFIV
jgi:hypothetical protein